MVKVVSLPIRKPMREREMAHYDLLDQVEVDEATDQTSMCLKEVRCQ